MNRRFLKYAARFSLFLIGLIGFYFLLAFCLSRITINAKPVNKSEVAIYIMTNGVHTDIVMPAISDQINWTKEISYQNTLEADSSYQYVAVGWGDKKFYIETPGFEDLKLGTAIRAISGLSTSAMHTTYYQNISEDNDCKKIMISREQYKRLIDYVLNSFEKDKAGHLIPIKTPVHYDIGDAFYEAKGSYSIFKTCNTWTNAALKACGQKSCLWTIFDTGIFIKYR
ncbi:TIGR02117 family protein [Pedobacter ghigonis]|uniref:TIGR02117 family protein n=1 Tax=Pedobacter ghigonis TaxID=2730403 RepID=UPI000FA74F54|nr:TIGR02117 family protein [Pedobacter ghigonis]